MLVDVETSDAGMPSANADDGGNDEDNGGRGARSANDDEMDETHPVDDKDVVSHVFLPVTQRTYVFSTRILI
jgi:hypothetical protein